MTNLKCVFCDKKANYVAKGNSVCVQHRPVVYPFLPEDEQYAHVTPSSYHASEDITYDALIRVDKSQ